MVAGAALAAALTFGSGAGIAGADGTQTPVGAPTIRLGVTEFGDTRVPNTSPAQEYFRLPAVRAGDLVTVAARTPPGAGRRWACLAADVDGFNWQQEGCNLANAVIFRESGSRIQFRASRATNNAFLRVYTTYDYGAFEVTVERIQRQVGLALSAPGSLQPNGAVSVSARLTNGQSVPDGHRVQLAARVKGRTHTYVSTTRGGRATFQLNLPGDAVGSTATLTAQSPETSTYQAASTIPANIRIVK